MRWRDLRPTAERLAARHGFIADGTDAETVVGRVVHELAHNLDLQINRAEMMPTVALDLYLKMGLLGDERCDSNEMRALAVQELWFERHGLGRVRSDRYMARGYLMAARIKQPAAVVARRFRAVKGEARTATIADRIDEAFGLTPRRQVARRAPAVAAGQMELA